MYCTVPYDILLFGMSFQYITAFFLHAVENSPCQQLSNDSEQRLTQSRRITSNNITWNAPTRKSAGEKDQHTETKGDPMASLPRNPWVGNLEALPRDPKQQCSRFRNQVCPSKRFSPCALLSYTTCFITTGSALAPRQGSSPTPGQRCDLFEEDQVGRLYSKMQVDAQKDR